MEQKRPRLMKPVERMAKYAANSQKTYAMVILQNFLY
jgi:hypothetical protein